MHKAKQIEMYEADVIAISELKERTNTLTSSISRFENQLETLQEFLFCDVYSFAEHFKIQTIKMVILNC